MMGPIFAYNDQAHLHLLFAALRAEKIEVRDDSESPRHAFWFCRRWGLIHGTPIKEAGLATMQLVYGHPFNPVFWCADGRLLKGIEEVFTANGSRRIAVDEVG